MSVWFVITPSSMATSGKTSCTLKTNGARRARATSQPASPSVRGGDKASTASGRPRVSVAMAPESAVNAPNAAARAGMSRLSVGNGCTRVIRPHSVSSWRTRRPRHSFSTRWVRYHGRAVTTWTWCSRAANSVTIRVITSPVGAMSGSKCGQMTSSFIRCPRGLRRFGTPRTVAPASPATEALPRAAAGRSHGIASFGLLQQRHHGFGPLAGVVRVDEHPPCPDHLGQGRRIGGDDRTTVIHRLEHRQPRPLEQGRERERGRVPVHPREIRARYSAHAANAAGHTSITGLRPNHILERRAAPREHEQRVGVKRDDVGERADEQDVILVWVGDRRVEEERSVDRVGRGGIAAGPGARDSHGRRYDDDTLRGNPQVLDDGAPGVLRHGDDRTRVACRRWQPAIQVGALHQIEVGRHQQGLKIVDREQRRSCPHQWDGATGVMEQVEPTPSRVRGQPRGFGRDPHALAPPIEAAYHCRERFTKLGIRLDEGT